jgi:aspartate kinase
MVCAAMIVMKFGGSSVADRSQIDKVRVIVDDHARRGLRPVVVCSAHKGITDALVQSARRAASGHYDPDPVIARQEAVREELGVDAALLAPLYQDLRDILRGLSLVRELSPRSLDLVSSFGERFSVRVIAAFFTARGLPARAFDVWDLGFVTDAEFGAARPLPGYEEKMRAAVAALDPAVVPIVTGFVGKTESGEVTTVGRNGSDLTATLVGAAIGASEVQIWSDTDGVMTADPRLVPSAKNIPEMRFDEAAELAYFGSRMLHPATLLPAMQVDIPVRVLNTNRADHRGTVIRKVAKNDGRVTSIAYKERQLVLTVSSTRMFGEAGFLERVFAVCRESGVVVDVVTTSEVSVSLTGNAEGPIREAAAKLTHLGDVTVDPNRSIVAVVGQHLPARRGLAAEIFGALAKAEVNVEMVSFAKGSINLSFVVEDRHVGAAVAALHGILFEAS